ncbi:MAG: DnaJ domain-containing protein [Glaciihabitans sp.]
MVSGSNAYEVLGVVSTASEDELRRAYRRALRRTHPDTGGVAVEFHAVQRAWEAIGTPESRERYDRTAASSARYPTPGTAPASAPGDRWGQRPTSRTRFRTPPERSYGQPGGWWTRQYLEGAAEWMARMGLTADPFDPQLWTVLPAQVRQCLLAARTEQATARALEPLGSAFTVWNDISTEVDGGNAEEKLDHIVLGPTGLFALLSEDRGTPMFVRGGDVTGDGFGWRERPIRTLSSRAAFFSENVGVRFTAVVMVVPDDAGIDNPTEISRLRGVSAVIVNRSDVAGFLRLGLPGTLPVPADTVAAARDHLRRTIQFV